MSLSRLLALPAPRLRSMLFPLVAVALLVLFGRFHFLAFHAIAEFLSIGVAWALLAVMWHSYGYTRNHLLMFLSLGFFWLAGIDLIHTLAYKGMGVFVDYGGNLPTQLWIAARFLEALLLLVAPVMIHRPVAAMELFTGMGALTFLLVAAIFRGMFPDTFIEGVGLTPFKVYTEYVIILLLILAAIHFRHHRSRLEPGLYKAILLLVAFTVLSELAFTQYVSLYGPSNLVGHVFKVLATWVLYVAIVNYPLQQISTAAREQQEIAEQLRVSEAALQESNRFLNLALDSQLDTFFVFEPASGRATRWNRAFRDLSGYSDAEIATLKAPDSYYDTEDLRKANAAVAAAGPHDSINIELALICKDGRRIPTEYSVSFITDEHGKSRYIIAVGRDVTDHRRNLDKAREQLAELRRWQAVMLDREERMLVLKGEVNALLQRLGEPPRYADTLAPEGIQAPGKKGDNR